MQESWAARHTLRPELEGQVKVGENRGQKQPGVKIEPGSCKVSLCEPAAGFIWQ